MLVLKRNINNIEIIIFTEFKSRQKKRNKYIALTVLVVLAAVLTLATISLLVNLKNHCMLITVKSPISIDLTD